MVLFVIFYNAVWRIRHNGMDGVDGKIGKPFEDITVNIRGALG
ncbi:MAG TPA: hypothetical protein VGR55_02640 [Candidatus Acidoferrum sp.]|nr:hypothetical protein [Candidatus Acidoferrum sp.]